MKKTLFSLGSFGLALGLVIGASSLASLVASSGCGGETPMTGNNPDPNKPDPNNPNPPDPNNPNPNETSLSGALTASQSLSGTVILADDVTVPAGMTLTLAPGTVVKAASGKSLIVRGTLAATGTGQQKIVFQGKDATAPGSWGGIAVASGGSATLGYVEIRHARQAFQALAGSTFALDHALIEQSSNALILRASGPVTKTVIHALGSSQSGPPVDIADSSPTFTDVLIDQSNAGTDHIVVAGASSSPQFDHMELTGCHCAFHFNDGTNINVTNSYIHDNYYALMLYGTKNVKFSNTNMVTNRTTHLGLCSGGTLTSMGNFFSGTNTAFDGSCTSQTNTAQATSMLQGVGYRP